MIDKCKNQGVRNLRNWGDYYIKMVGCWVRVRRGDLDKDPEPGLAQHGRWYPSMRRRNEISHIPPDGSMPYAVRTEAWAGVTVSRTSYFSSELFSRLFF
jgi:hypothetical protein